MKLLCLVGMRGKSAPRHTELSGKYLEPVTFALCLFHRLYVVGRCFLLCSCSGKIRAGSLQCGSLRDRQHEKTGPELDKLKDTRSVTHKVYIHVHVYIYIYTYIHTCIHIHVCYMFCAVYSISFKDCRLRARSCKSLGCHLGAPLPGKRVKRLGSEKGGDRELHH